MDTNANLGTIGVVSQTRDGREKMIAYDSRILIKQKRNC